jgi:putative ABC transport system permease protein
MFSAQFSKVLNDVWGNKTRTFLIVLSIAVGLLALGTVLNGGTLISEGTAQSYAAIHYANGLLVTGQSLDNNSIRAFANIEGIGEVDGRRELDVRAISAANTYTNIQVFSVPDYTNMRVNQITPTGGAWPPPRHQILIDGASLTVLGAQVGGKITIETASGDLRILPIVGTVQDLSLPPANFAGTVYGYVDQDTMEWLGSQTGFNELYFTLPPLPGAPQSSNQSKAETQKVLTRMTDKAENAGYTVTTSQVVSESPITSVTNTLLYVLTGISGLSLFLSVFLIFNTITSMVTQQIRQIGVMKAIGGRARQILWMYISVVVFYGLIALLIAVPLSILAGAQLGQFLAGSFGFTIHSSPIQPVNILIQVGIGILVPVLASLLPLINGLRISATQALSSEGISQGNYGANLG